MSLAVVPDPGEQPEPNELPPHDIDAEQSVLGAMMLAGRTIEKVQSLVSASDFFRPAHQTIFQTITDLHANKAPTDAIAVNSALTTQGLIKRVGGAVYLHTLTEVVSTPASAAYYADIVAQRAAQRRVMEAGARIYQMAAASDGEVGDLVEHANHAVSQLKTASDSWPEPTPLDAVAAEVPEFPLLALPDWIGQYAAAVSDLTQTPPDLAGCLGLAALSAAASGRVWVNTGTWEEPACIYTIAALEPATRKSAVFAAINAPLFDAEKKLVERMGPVIREAEISRRVAVATAEEAAAKAEKERTPQAMAEAVEAAESAAQMKVPSVPKLVAADITPENLARRLAEQEGRLALLAPEGGFFGTLAGRYSGGIPNLDTFLQAHAGERIMVDRQNRDPDYIDKPALTIGIALQPEALNEIFSTPGGRGKGVFARILYAVPKDNVGYRSSKHAVPVPPEVEQRYVDRMQSLLYSTRSLDEPVTLAFTQQARERIRTLMDDEVEIQLRPDGRFGQIRDWGGKFVGAIVRIAALLHLAEHLTDGWGQPISLATVKAAEEIGEFYAAHALAVFGLMGADPVHATARKIFDWLAAHPRRQLSHRDLFTAVRTKQIAKSSDLEAPLELLTDLGWIRPLPPPEKKGRGRKPSPTYLIHPQLAKGGTTV
ncbi:DUF3987 domain-containing protein [Nocardiopsis rhodophaea]|uniref:DUF3987 domain-containing protein n=1 Tax=Nocardiopsis rhodophaea TaxID=280238 RepID=UPI0031E17239